MRIPHIPADVLSGAAEKNVDRGDEDMIKWDFVVPVDESVFNEFERNYGVEVPEDLRELVLEANAGNPEP